MTVIVFVTVSRQYPKLFIKVTVYWPAAEYDLEGLIAVDPVPSPKVQAAETGAGFPPLTRDKGLFMQIVSEPPMVDDEDLIWMLLSIVLLHPNSLVATSFTL